VKPAARDARGEQPESGPARFDYRSRRFHVGGVFARRLFRAGFVESGPDQVGLVLNLPVADLRAVKLDHLLEETVGLGEIGERLPRTLAAFGDVADFDGQQPRHSGVNVAEPVIGKLVDSILFRRVAPAGHVPRRLDADAGDDLGRGRPHRVQPEERFPLRRDRRRRDRDRKRGGVRLAFRFGAEPENVISGPGRVEQRQLLDPRLPALQREVPGEQLFFFAAEGIECRPDLHIERPVEIVEHPDRLPERLPSGKDDFARSAGAVHSDRERRFRRVGSRRIPFGKLERVEPDGHAFRLLEMKVDAGHLILRLEMHREPLPLPGGEVEFRCADLLVALRADLDTERAGLVRPRVAGERVGQIGAHHPEQVTGRNSAGCGVDPGRAPPLEGGRLIGRQREKRAASLERPVGREEVDHRLFRLRAKRRQGRSVEIEFPLAVLPAVDEEQEAAAGERERVGGDRDFHLFPVERSARGGEQVDAAAGRE